MYKNVRLHIGVMFLSFASLPLQGFWSSTPKHWGIEDFISKKCYEVDNETDQQRCIAVKEFLLEARKQELEERYLKIEAVLASVTCGVMGFLTGVVLGALRNDAFLLEVGSIGGYCLGLCAGPIHYKLVKNEREKTIPESVAFYAKCLQDKHLINRTPREVLDELEYAPRLCNEERLRMKSKIIRVWATKEAGS